MIISHLPVLKLTKNPDKNNFKKSFRLNFGFKPSKVELFELAFQHRSINPIQNSNNERLEFLGDSVLSTIISDLFYNHYPDGNEGFLSKMRSKIANREFLNEISVKMGIDKFVKYDKSIKLEDRPLTDIYGNALEAFIGAIYIDKGYKFTKKYVIERIINKFVDIGYIKSLEHNYKGRLNELAQKENLDIKFLVEEEKENHNIVYIAKVMINGKILGSGSGHKKKHAEQKAAEIACKSITSGVQNNNLS